MSNKSVLDELLEKVGKSNFDEQVKQICDQIMNEERSKFNNLELEPKAPNIFLAIQCNKFDDTKISFLCLEREMKEKYIVVLMSKTTKKDLTLKRQTVWEANFEKPEKILKFFAEKLKFVRGDV